MPRGFPRGLLLIWLGGGVCGLRASFVGVGAVGYARPIVRHFIYHPLLARFFLFLAGLAAEETKGHANTLRRPRGH